MAARAATFLALLALASPAIASEDLTAAALAADDACQGDDATCSVELRQLRAHEILATEKAKQDKVAQVPEDTEPLGSAFCCFSGKNISDMCGTCFDNAMAMEGSEVEKQYKGCTAGAGGCKGCGGTWCSGASALETAGLLSVDPVLAQGKETKAKVESKSVKSGGCTTADEAIIAKLGGGHGSGSFPKIVADCGHGAYSFWRGFRKSQLTSCVTDETGLSASCAACFGDAGQYGYNNCKLQCLFGSWCSDSCLSCTKAGQADVTACVGDITMPKATEC